MGGELLEDEVDIEAEGGHWVNDVDRASDEEERVGAGDKSGYKFNCKPDDADAYNVKEGIVDGCAVPKIKVPN